MCETDDSVDLFNIYYGAQEFYEHEKSDGLETPWAYDAVVVQTPRRASLMLRIVEN